MKYLIPILFLLFPVIVKGHLRDTVPNGVPQLFGGKYYKFNGYVLVDSFIMNTPGDTNNVPRYPSLKFKSSDNRWYGYDRSVWQKLLYASDTTNHTLQQVTDAGNKTTDTIIAEAIRTKRIIGDTLDEPDFEIDVVPDQQYISHGNADSSLMGNAFNWMANNRIANNLKAVLQVGDLTDDGFVSQFQRVDSNFDKLDLYDIPYLYCPGNHDYANGSVNNTRNLTNYNTWMGPSRYAGRSWYGGNLDGNNANYYIKLDVGKQKFIIVALEFTPRDTAVNWANRVLDSFPDRRAIIVTHGHITTYSEKSNDTTQWGKSTYSLIGNSGVELFDKLLRKHANVFMVLNGHFLTCCGGIETLNNLNLAPPMFSRLIQAGDYGNVINQIAVNYQTDSLGGAGRLMRLKFRPSAGLIEVSSYSTRNGANDTRVSSYALAYPEIQMEGTVGVSKGLFVNGETHLNDSVFVQYATENRLFIAGKNGRLDTLSNSDSAKVLFSNGFGKKPTFRSILSTDLPTGSNNYIQNLTPVPNTLTGMQTGTFWLKGTAVVGGPTGAYTTMNGVPATFYVSHQSGNWGLSVQRAAGVNTSGANISLAHTYGANWSTPVAVGIGAELGTISWFGTTGNLTLSRAMSVRGFTYGVGANYVSTGWDFRSTDLAGTEREVMRINSSGNMALGTAYAPGTIDTFRLNINHGDIAVAGLGGSGNVIIGAQNNGKVFKYKINGLRISNDTIYLNTPTSSGTYTPAITNISNIDASTAYPCQYMRVGNTVTVSGKVDIDPTAAAATSIGISLPIASAIANDYEGGGTGSAGLELFAGSIKADATNDRVQFDFVIPAAGTTGNTSWFFSFTYQIL